MKFAKAARYGLTCYRRGGAAGLLNMARGYRTLKTEPLVVPYSPFSLYVEPTLRCNLNCLMCDTTLRSRTRDQMTLARFQGVIDQFPYLQRLAIQGVGEPLLNPDFFDMIGYAKSKQVFVYFNTNACLLNERNLERLLAAGPDEVRVSLDGADRKTYERLRPGSSFELVTGNLKRLASRAPGRLTVAIWFLATRENLDEMPLMPGLARRLGVRHLYVQSLHSWGNEEMVGKLIEPLGLQRGEMRDVIESTRREAAAKGVRLQLASDFFGGEVKRGCQFPWFLPYVTVEGFVTPCCMQGCNPEVIHFGNLFEKDFREIWNNEAYQRFRAALKSESPPRICRGCPAYYTGVLS